MVESSKIQLLPAAPITITLPLLLEQYLECQRDWSQRTFGAGKRTRGLCEHIRKELVEIEAAPGDLEEWIDVLILALDGYWRAGGTAIMADLERKQQKNFARQWPTPTSEDVPVEHIRCM